MSRGHRPPVPPVVLADYKAQQMDEGALPIVDENGVTHLIPPPTLWPDAAVGAAADGDPVAAAVALLGEDGYATFVAGGGSATALLSIVEAEQGGMLGESKA